MILSSPLTVIRRPLLALLAGGLLGSTLSGCDLPEPMGSWVKEITGGAPPAATTAASPSPGAALSVEEIAQRTAKRAQSNAEFLQEMFRVVLLKEVQGSTEFPALLDTLNQGASLEGVYNGLVHSSQYREIEAGSGAASPASLKFFAEELAAIEMELPERTFFDSTSGKPLARIEMPTGYDTADPNAAARAESIAPQKAAATVSALAGEYVKVFVGASPYTLKRVLGDEALKLITSKSKSKTDLVTWYIAFVARMVEKKVDFGLDLRNKADSDFHRNWAMTASMDKLQWEVLNRLHRVLNVGLAKR